MTQALILLTLPDETLNAYRDRLRAQFPHIKVDLVHHLSEIDPYIADTDVLITFPLMLRDEVLQKAKKLKWVQALGTGTDNLIDLPSLKPEVHVTNVRGIHGAPLSESALCSMLALARRLPRSLRSQAAKTWDRWPSMLITGKTVGIFGVGAIAEEFAPRCKALGLKVVGISSAPERKPAGFDEMRSSADLAAAVADLDFLVLLTPLSAKTRHSVDARVLSAMKPSSFLVNIARGGIVDETALLDALAKKTIAGAAIDVFEQEPLPPEHPLWNAGNIIITSHLAGYNDEYIDGAMPIVAHNMTCFLEGRLDDMKFVVKR